MTQSTIEFVPVSPVAHRDDPATSHAAARQITRSGERKRQADMLLDGMKAWAAAWGNEWATSAEWADILGVDRHLAARRLPELSDPKNGHLVERGEESRLCRITGYKAIVWRVRERGE